MGEGGGDQARFSRQLALRFSLIAMLDRIGFVQTFETPKSGEIKKEYSKFEIFAERRDSKRSTKEGFFYSFLETECFKEGEG